MPPGSVRVAANARWVDTGFTLRRTDRVQFTTEGQVQLSGDADDKAGPAGSLRGRYASNAPAPSLLAGALIGRIGNGAPFAIGDQTVALPMPGDGTLFLAVNDDEVSDKAFVVTLRVTAVAAARDIVVVAAVIARRPLSAHAASRRHPPGRALGIPRREM
jgi:hypothetical protein